MESISFEYRRGVEEDTRDQMLKLSNKVEPEETKVKHEENKKVFIEEEHKYVNPQINLLSIKKI